MTELRKDYLLDRYVIIAAGRSKRPHQFVHEKGSTGKDKKAIEEEKKKCFFCPGNESMTPSEVYRLTHNHDWQIRVFPNKFAAVDENTDNNDAEIKTHNEFFTFADAVGAHEVVVETPDHEKQLVDLSVEEMVDIFKTYIMRIKELEKKQEIKYVFVLKNHGKDAGTSIVHSHSQIIAYNLIPTIILQKEKAVARYAEDAAKKDAENAAKTGAEEAGNSPASHCPYCRILNIEKTSHRKVHENNTFVCFTPYASRMPYEIWFFPKRHVVHVKDLNDDELHDLCEILKKVIVKLKALDSADNGASFNYYLHNGTGKEKQFHFHLELLPRTSKWAGFELGSETIINTTSPEDAAEYYRE